MGHAPACLPTGGLFANPQLRGEFQLDRKMTALLLCAVCSLLLASCGKQEPEQTETQWSEVQMAQAIWDSQPDLESQALLYGEHDFDGYLADAYQIDPSDVVGGAVLYAGGVNAQEIAVLRLAENADVHAAVTALEDYIFIREGAFAGYAPEQYAVLEQSAAAERGRYTALLICPDQNAARDALAACFTSPPPQATETREPDIAVLDPEPIPAPAPDPEPQPEQGPDSEVEQQPEPGQELGTEQQPEPASEPEPEPESDPNPGQEAEPDPEQIPDWSYNASRIADAWYSGEREGLWTEDLAILSVLDQIPALTNTDLSDYDRELALHDWMLEWAEYDPGAISSGPIGDPIPHNDNPYGLLVGRKGICLGYTATFQLLMELCGIECLTVHGTAHMGTDAHAWNMVRLDGEWYAVDVTWDDPVSSVPIPVYSFIAHRFFNVTSDYLRESDHQWDENAVPEANGTAFAWAG